MSTCDVCGKEFSKKVGLQKHIERKIPCKVPMNLIQVNIHRALEKAGISNIEAPTTEFRESSKKFNTCLSKEERLEQGIFFTQKKARDVLFSKLKDIGVHPNNILEPSFGTGEFLLDARRIYPDANIFGV